MFVSTNTCHGDHKKIKNKRRERTPCSSLELTSTPIMLFFLQTARRPRSEQPMSGTHDSLCLKHRNMFLILQKMLSDTYGNSGILYLDKPKLNHKHGEYFCPPPKKRTMVSDFIFSFFQLSAKLVLPTKHSNAHHSVQTLLNRCQTFMMQNLRINNFHCNPSVHFKTSGTQTLISSVTRDNHSLE